MKKFKGCSRRDFIKYSASAAAMASLQFKRMLQAAPAPITGPYGAVSPALTKFVDRLRTIGGDIPLAAADAAPAPVTGVQHYTIDIGQFNNVLHSDFVNPLKAAYIPGFAGTKLWGYGQGGNHKHLGGIILAQRNVPLQITFNNQLPNARPSTSSLPEKAPSNSRSSVSCAMSAAAPRPPTATTTNPGRGTAAGCGAPLISRGRTP